MRPSVLLLIALAIVLGTPAARAERADEKSPNQPPVLSPLSDRSVDTGDPLNFTVTASDPDGTTPALSASPLPEGATFANGAFSWTPKKSQTGSYTVQFTAGDGALTAGQAVNITVRMKQYPPRIEPIGDQTATVNEQLIFNVSASDANDTVPALKASAPEGAVFADGIFAWTPVLAQVGTHQATFTATDESGLSDTQTISIHVQAKHAAPAIAEA